MNRREFLKKLGLGGAAAVAAPLVAQLPEATDMIESAPMVQIYKAGHPYSTAIQLHRNTTIKQ